MAFVCRYCGVSKNTPGALQRHEASHRQPSHMCDICGKCYKRKDTLTRHNSVIHESKSKYKCEEHKLIFSSSAHQREHMESQHGHEKSHKCDRCRNGFTSKQGLDYHIAHNVCQKQFKCGVCSKEFERRKNLSQHMLCHQTPQHVCVRCGMRFKRNSNLQRHMKRHNK